MTKRKIEYWVIPPDQDAEWGGHSNSAAGGGQKCGTMTLE
jgi:hypothetical protein